MTQIRPLYNKFAEYYDLLHSEKNYAGEVKTLNKIIKQYKKSNGRELLDVACGTGRHLLYLKKTYACTGIDLHKSMLHVARKNVNGVYFKQAEMESFQFRKHFDIITCLYGGISYNLTAGHLQATLRNFESHLNPDGLVIIEPYFTDKQFTPNQPNLSTIESKDIKIARVSLSRRKRKLASRKTIMSIVEKNKGVISFEDERDVALFSPKQILSNMHRAGLKSIHIKNGISSQFDLYVGVKE